MRWRLNGVRRWVRRGPVEWGCASLALMRSNRRVCFRVSVGYWKGVAQIVCTACLCMCVSCRAACCRATFHSEHNARCARVGSLPQVTEAQRSSHGEKPWRAVRHAHHKHCALSVTAGKPPHSLHTARPHSPSSQSICEHKGQRTGHDARRGNVPGLSGGRVAMAGGAATQTFSARRVRG